MSIALLVGGKAAGDPTSSDFVFDGAGLAEVLGVDETFDGEASVSGSAQLHCVFVSRVVSNTVKIFCGVAAAMPLPRPPRRAKSKMIKVEFMVPSSFCSGAGISGPFIPTVDAAWASYLHKSLGLLVGTARSSVQTGHIYWDGSRASKFVQRFSRFQQLKIIESRF